MSGPTLAAGRLRRYDRTGWSPVGSGGCRSRDFAYALEVPLMFTAFISLIFGLIIGYLAQRSRMCFIGGMRDFVLVRDTYLLKGLVAFFVTAAILFPLANALGGDTLGYPW